MWSVVQEVLLQAWHQFVAQCLTVLPNLLASLFLLLAGLAVSVLAGGIARVILRRAGLDRRADRIGLAAWLERVGVLSLTLVLVRAVQALVVLVTAVLVLYALDDTLATDLVRQFLLYLPRLIVAVVLFAAGVVFSSFAARGALIGAVNLGLPSPRLLAASTRTAVLLLAGVVTLDQIGIGGTTLSAAFLVVLGGVTLAAALAVGLGSQDVVRRWHEERRQAARDDPNARMRHW